MLFQERGRGAHTLASASLRTPKSGANGKTQWRRNAAKGATLEREAPKEREAPTAKQQMAAKVLYSLLGKSKLPCQLATLPI
jgi:hypothetical protein